MRSSSWPTPASSHSARRRRMVRSEQPGWRDVVATAVHQRGDHMVEHDPVRDPATVTVTVTTPRVGRREFGRSADPIRAANSTHNGSTRDAVSRGMDSPDDHQDFSNPMITCGSDLYLQRHAVISFAGRSKRGPPRSSDYYGGHPAGAGRLLPLGRQLSRQ